MFRSVCSTCGHKLSGNVSFFNSAAKKTKRIGILSLCFLDLKLIPDQLLKISTLDTGTLVERPLFGTTMGSLTCGDVVLGAVAVVLDEEGGEEEEAPPITAMKEQSSRESCRERNCHRKESVCCRDGDGAGLSEDDGEVEEGRGEEQAGGADQRVGAGGPRPQLPADHHAAGHAQHPRHHGDGAEDQTVGGGTAQFPSTQGGLSPLTTAALKRNVGAHRAREPVTKATAVKPRELNVLLAEHLDVGQPAGVVQVVNPPADRDGEIEDGEHVGPLPLHVEVCDDGGGDGGVAGLSDAHQAPGQQQGPEVLGPEEEGGAGESHQGPEQDAHAHDVLPVVPVAQVTKHRSQEHVDVAQDEDGQQGSDLRHAARLLILLRAWSPPALLLRTLRLALIGEERHRIRRLLAQRHGRR
ncbi:hypothetical protein F7725_002954 [Dissostichus mawsoni]|uniref:Uncharacterized protein n=1 Tax=Dissostichus mawsoni TaxID=36200 RepID=A0A7J5Y8Y9_DISMA|nr:hypothetical protein F7725_002954 [Dissostichus mawsoni]